MVRIADAGAPPAHLTPVQEYRGEALTRPTVRALFALRRYEGAHLGVKGGRTRACKGGILRGNSRLHALEYIFAEADRQSNIGFLPTGLRPWGLGFLCPPAPGAPVDSLQSATVSDSIAYQGHICITSIPHCNRGVKGGGAPHENRKSKIRKADALKTENQSVQGVQGKTIFSHTI